MAYYFKAFGLNIKSEYPFQGSKPYEEGFFDVNITKGKVPNQINKAIYKGINFEGRLDKFILKVENVANYYVANGHNIIIDAYKEAELREIELFLLGSAMSALLLQRGIIPFHGSAFVKDDKAIIISGKSGSGKSSLLNFFIEQGFEALTDDVCALNIVDNKVLCYPSYPSSKVWEDVMNKMDFDTQESLLVRPNIEKYRVDISNHFCTDAKEVSQIYILKSHNQLIFDTKKISGMQKFSTLSDNLYRPKFPHTLNKEKETFKILELLAKQIELFLITRSNDFSMFNAFNTFALQQISK